VTEPKLQRKGSPRGALRVLLRAPIGLYRVGLGFLLGKRVLMLEHLGRKSGKTRRTLLEVVLNEDDAVYVGAGWGTSAQWLRNIQADPSVVVYLGAKRYETRAVIVDREEARRVMDAYAGAHPRALPILASRMLDDPSGTLAAQAQRLADTIPMVRLSKTV
jgi:deazaflavin-dependent oxidoreductase (nitroreductase family)